MENLRIGFDAKRAVMNYSGIGNYSRLALESLHKLRPDDTLVLFTPKIKDNPQLKALLDEPKIHLSTPDRLSGRLLPSLWRSKWLTSQLRRESIDLYHGLSNELPLGIEKSDIPSVVTIHDLIFLRHPEFYHAPDVKICDKKFRYAAEAATRVIAISERTSKDLIELYGIEPGKIDIVYQGCADIFYKPISNDEIKCVKEKYGLPQKYIIGVGTIESRKNQLLTLRSLKNLPADISIVLVGRQTAYARQIRETAENLGLSKRLIMIQGAPFTDFPALYAGAIFASYPSYYEGFGIPMLEALAAGVPVIAATGSCLEEAGGPGAIYVHPDSVEEYTEAALSLIGSPELREQMVREGREYIKRFDATKFADGLLDTYRKILRF